MDRAGRTVIRRAAPLAARLVMAVLTLTATVFPAPQGGLGVRGAMGAASSPSAPVANFTSAINRLVELVGLAGGGILALVWARVALSWFSNDVTKKIQAKDRARDALVGTLLFVAAVSGMIYGLAHWVVTGS